MPPQTSHPPHDVNIVDGLSLYQAGERVKQDFDLEKAPLNYTALHRVLGEIRQANGFRPTNDSSLPISYDPNSVAQQRFLTAIEQTKKFDIDPVNFRELYVSLPPGMTPRDVKDSDDKPIASFASRIAYVLGRLSRHSDPHILVVTHCYEVLWPLQNLKLINHSARVGVAYFDKFLDYRWQYARLDTSDSPVQFFSLDKHMPELFGIDQAVTANQSSQQSHRREATGLTKY